VRLGQAANALFVAIGQIWLVLVRLAAGDEKTALSPLGDAATLATMVAANTSSPMVLMLLAHAAVLRGDANEAKRLRTEAGVLDLPGPAGAWFAFTSAEIAVASGEYARAAQIAHDELSRSDLGRPFILISDLNWIEGEALLRAGDLSAASAALARARSEAERRGSQRSLWLIFWSLARLADAEGRAIDAVGLRRRARAIVDAIAESLLPLGLAERFKSAPYVRALLEETPT
jgi:hypothetical protein